MKTVILFLLLFLGLQTHSLWTQAVAGAPTVLDQRSQSRIHTARTILVDTPASWQALWQEHVGPQEKLPVVDFQKERVLGLFLGPRPSAGYGVVIEQIRTRDGYLEVHYREIHPPRDQFVAQVPSYPACLVRLPAGPKLPLRLIDSQAPSISAQSKESLSMRTLSRVSNSRITEARFVIARDQATFRQLWKEHNGSLEQLPEVDFNTEMVAAVMMGERSTGGYAVTIERIETEANRLKIYYSESEPPPGSMTIQILTAPAHLIALPQSENYPEFIKIPTGTVSE